MFEQQSGAVGLLLDSAMTLQFPHVLQCVAASGEWGGISGEGSMNGKDTRAPEEAINPEMSLSNAKTRKKPGPDAKKPQARRGGSRHVSRFASALRFVPSQHGKLTEMRRGLATSLSNSLCDHARDAKRRPSSRSVEMNGKSVPPPPTSHHFTLLHVLRITIARWTARCSLWPLGGRGGVKHLQTSNAQS